MSCVHCHIADNTLPPTLPGTTLSSGCATGSPLSRTSSASCRCSCGAATSNERTHTPSVVCFFIFFISPRPPTRPSFPGRNPATQRPAPTERARSYRPMAVENVPPYCQASSSESLRNLRSVHRAARLSQRELSLGRR